MTFEQIYGPHATYGDASKNIFASGSIPDGYFGDRLAVQFSLVGGRIFTVHKWGCFNTGLPMVVDVAEALFILEKHPSSNAKNIIPF